MKKKAGILLLGFAMLVGLYSCTKDKTTVASALDCSGVNASTNTYSTGNANIQTILGLWCAYAPCHGGGSTQQGINFDTYANTVNAFKNNDITCALKATNGCILMPNGGPRLPDSTILQIQCWQANGYPQ